MEEGPEESVEAEEEEVSEAPPRKGRRTLIVVAAVVIVVALIAGIVVYLLFQNSPPQPSFVATSVDLHLSVNAESTADPDGDSIANYSWNFGDAGSSTNLVTGANKVAATHDYTTIGKYTVTLTVVDSRGLGASTNQVITIVILPTPYFIARQSGMTTSFDGSGSFATGNKTIAAYQWTFGDGQTLNTGQTPTTTHQYTTPGRYNVTLTVTDSGGTNNSVSHWVSVNTSTVDVLADQFFQAGCPYGQWWNLRFHTYGDVLPAPSNSLAPCTDFYPWVLYSQSQAATNPSWVYTLYHLDMQATDNLGYNLGQPVVLPVFNYSAAPGQYIYYNFTFKYLDSQSISYWDTTPWPVSSKYSDGFGYLVIGNITMDLQESRRIFGVVGGTPAQAQAWWNASTKPGSLVGPLENKTGAWLDQLGNGKYDIYNAFQWYYESDIADLNATVNPTTGQTNVKVFFDGWGWDVLMARWFYWGNTSYQAAVNAPYGQYAPRGWMPFETCWCENATVALTIRNGMDVHMGGTSEYWFGAVGNPGPDGVVGTQDDLAGWSFSPSLMDYMPPVGSGLAGASQYPNSELKWYEQDNQIVNMPGSFDYGTAFEYMVVPSRWNTSLGNSLTLVMPRTEVPWYDPVKSQWNPAAGLGNYTSFMSKLTLRSVTPSGDYYKWDERGKVLSIAWAPTFQWANANLHPLDSSPTIEFGPETTA